MDAWVVWLLFAVAWIITFFPAWHLLLWLMAFASTGRRSLKSPKFIATFVAYRVLIALPYVVLLLGGDELPGIVKSLIIGLVVTALILSMIRFFLARKAGKLLWYLYGLVYDGLTKFFPYRLLLSEVDKYADIRSGQSVLDLGCGTGNFSKLLLEKYHGLRIDAVDSSTTMLNQARKKLGTYNNVTVIDEDLVKFLRNSKSETYDRIILVNVVYAVADRTALWKELMRVIRKDGLVVFTTSDRKGSWPIIQEHIKNAGWISLLRPRLVLIFIIDAFISKLASVGQFEFQPLGVFESEIKGSGGKILKHKRCYGGDKKGVNILAAVARD